ncbi:RICIN domain-containing protein [Streptomyces sp. NBC_01381]|uniref:RICIN domain-containing protein n=1 Tax=Streptomyces sp. NBC_01381 TaxID=2903845 RepID=UPI00225600CF|nr:RICIN domain-containing protein [Streptomyces sp. NBC_01381]MCX4666320.1 RICIN domain-containing protein [Streptomyces sp. NBC_01381]
MAGSPPDGVYLVRNDASGLYMELADANLGPNVPIVGAIASKLAGQQWEVTAFHDDDPTEAGDDNAYTIKSKVGDVYVGERASRRIPPRLGSRATPTAWIIEYVDEGTVRVRSPRSGDVFDLSGGDDGPEILLVEWNGRATQRWILEAV